MTDIKLNEVTGDVDITDGAASLVTGLDASIQSFKIAMQSFAGDWFLDLNDGLPYVGRILVKNVNEADVQQLFRAQALRQPDVVSVDRLELTLLPTSKVRQLKLDIGVTFAQSVESVNIIITQGLP